MGEEIPLLAEEGWLRQEENVPFPIWRGRGGQLGEIFRPEHFAELTTPSAALRWLRDFLLMPQPPLLCEEGNDQIAPVLDALRRRGKLRGFSICSKLS